MLGDVGEDVCHAGHAFARGFDVEFGRWWSIVGPIPFAAILGSRVRGNDVIVHGNDVIVRGNDLIVRGNDVVVVAVVLAICHGGGALGFVSGELFLEREEADCSLYAVYGVFSVAVGAHFVGEFSGDGCAADHDADFVAEPDVFEV